MKREKTAQPWLLLGLFGCLLGAVSCIGFDDRQFFSGSGQVTGILRDRAGTHISAAPVFLKSAASSAEGVPWQRAISDGEGSYFFPLVPSGLYVFAAMDDSGKGTVDQLMITRGARLEVNAVLEDFEQNPSLYDFLMEQLERPVHGLGSKKDIGSWAFDEDARLFAWSTAAGGGQWLVETIDLEHERLLPSLGPFSLPVDRIEARHDALAILSRDAEATVCSLEKNLGEWTSCRAASSLAVRDMSWVGEDLWLEAREDGSTEGCGMWRWQVRASHEPAPQKLLAAAQSPEVVSWDVCYDSDLITLIVEEGDGNGGRETKWYVLQDTTVQRVFEEGDDAASDALPYLRTGCSPYGDYAVSVAGNGQGSFAIYSANAPGDLGAVFSQRIMSFSVEQLEPPAVVGWGWTTDLRQFILQIQTAIGKVTVSPVYRFLNGWEPLGSGEENFDSSCDVGDANPDCGAPAGEPEGDGWAPDDDYATSRQDIPPPDPVLWRRGGSGVILSSPDAADRRQLFFDSFQAGGRIQLTFSPVEKADFCWSPSRQRIYYMSLDRDEAVLRTAPALESIWGQ